MSSVLSKGRVLGQSDRIRPGEGRPDKWVPPGGVGLRGNEFGQYSASGKHAPKKKEKKKTVWDRSCVDERHRVRDLAREGKEKREKNNREREK